MQIQGVLTIAFATRSSADQAQGYVQHLLETCGLPAERVSILPFFENRVGLCQVYNEVLRRAEGQYVALIHDDLSFERAPGWAKTLIGVFEAHPDFAVLGVAGASILQESGLWLHEQVGCGHIYHRQGNGKTELTRYALPHPCPLPAAALDGAFLIARTANVRGLLLDSDAFDGFHFYDMELCMQARAKGLRLGVTEALDLVHASGGAFGAEWERYRERFVAKYRASLPSNAMRPTDLFPFSEFSRQTTPGKSVAILIPIPTKDGVDRVRNAVTAIHNRTSPEIQYRIYFIDAGSSAAALAELRTLPDVTVLQSDFRDLAAIYNDVVLGRQLIQEDLLLFHHSDVELVNDALAHLLHAWQSVSKPGVVGARLHFANGLLSHAGLRVARRGREAVTLQNWGQLSLWNFSRQTRRDVTGSSLALALVDRKLYGDLGGLNESYQARCADVEFNLRAILAGRSNLLAGDAVALQHKSATTDPDAANAGVNARDQLMLAGFLEQNLASLAPYLEQPQVLDPVGVEG